MAYASATMKLSKASHNLFQKRDVGDRGRVKWELVEQASYKAPPQGKFKMFTANYAGMDL